MAKRVTKQSKVLEHLQQYGTITSMDAINLYGATRLADIIFKLRKTMDIKTIDCLTKDRYGGTCKYAKYVLDREGK